MKPGRFFVTAALTLVVIIAVALPGFATPRIHLSGVTVGVGYSHFSGPYYGYPYYPYRFSPYYPGWGPYGSLFFDPYWGPAAYGYDVQAADKGQVRLHNAEAQSQVYIDGAFAGLAKDLHTIWLAPGAYNVEIRPASGSKFEKRIYVLTGKSIDLRAGENHK